MTKAAIKLQWTPKTTFKGLAKLMYEADLETVKKLKK
jgi:GDP-D-mannose dehydratase